MNLHTKMYPYTKKKEYLQTMEFMTFDQLVQCVRNRKKMDAQ